jgi:hypothetical protein
MTNLITLTGLPRSGTAFCSMLFNLHPDCIAYHELASYDTKWRQTLTNSPYRYVADCSTYGFMPDAMMDSYRRIYIVHDAHRSRYAAEIATQKEVPLGLILKLSEIGSDWAVEENAFVIMREDVFTLRGMQSIWDICFSEDFPFLKATELLKLNVQHHNIPEKFGKNSKFTL